MLSIEEVIRLGELASESQYSFWIGEWWWWVIGVACLIITAFTEGASIIIWLLLHIGFTVTTSWGLENDNIEKWKNEIAKPYIEQLPIERNEIVYIKINTELSANVRGNALYTYTTQVKLTPLTVSFKGNGIETYTNWYEANMNLTDESKPYVEYQRLKHDLGNGVNSGIYNAKVYLPETYEFTDIK